MKKSIFSAVYQTVYSERSHVSITFVHMFLKILFATKITNEDLKAFQRKIKTSI